MKPLTLLPALLFLLGCGPTIIPFTATPELSRGYTVGRPATASVGEAMLSITSTSSAPAWIVTQDYTPPQHDSWKGGLDYPQLTKGMRFTKIADRSDGVIGIYNPDYQITIPGALTRAERKEEITIWIEPSGVVSETMEGRPWTGDVLFSKEASAAGSSYRGELIYTSREGNVVTMTFRESVNSGEPAATMVRHNLDDGRTVTLRDITIEVLKATETGIEYQVVSDEGLAWVR